MIGQTVGRYHIVAKLGDGGMGSVWKAEDPLLGRTIALKFLSRELVSSGEARARFLREARAASSLNHPGIAAVHDAGETEGRVYIAMQLVEGETVSERLSRGSVPVDEVLRIAKDAGIALDYAHRHGVLHRDVSSRNIIVGPEGEVVLLDFGLALAAEEMTITRPGTLLGTVAYMAPEVLQGEKADERSDVYSLGALLYEMLTGRVPHPGDRRETIVYAAVHESPAPPSRHRPDLAAALDHLVMTALAKRPENRYQSAGHFVDALEQAATGVAPSPTKRKFSGGIRPQEDLGSEARRKWLLASGLVAMASAASVLLVLHQSHSRHDDVPPSIPVRVAVLPFQNSSADPQDKSYVVDGIGASLAANLTKVLGSAVVPWITSRRFSDPSRIRDIARELKAQELVVGTLQISGERVKVTVSVVDAETETQRWADEFEEPFSKIFDLQARIAMNTAVQLKGQLTGQEKKDLRQPVSRDPEAYRAYLQGQELLKSDTRTAADSAYQFFAKAIDLDVNLAEAHVGMGSVLTDRFFKGWAGSRELDEAEAHFRRALTLSPRLHSARGGLVRVFWERGKSEECLKLGEEARQLGGEEVESLFIRAEAYVLGGFPEVAIPLFERVLDLDPASQGARWFLVIANNWAGKHQAAIEAGNRYFQEYGPDPEILTWVATSYREQGELDQALMYYRQAIQQFGEDTNIYVFLYAAQAADRMGARELERDLLQEAAGILDPLASAHPDNFRVRSLWACVWGALGNRQRFREEGNRFLAGEIEAGNGTGLFGNLHNRLGEFDRALEFANLLLRHGAYGEGPGIDWSYSLEELRNGPNASRPETIEFLRQYDQFGKQLSSRYVQPLP